MRLNAWDIAVSVGATGVMLLPENRRRISAVIVNDHAANTLYLKLGKVGAANQGIRLNSAGGTYEIGLDNPWTGEVWGIADGAGTTTLITEVSA